MNARQRRDADHARGRHNRQANPDCFGCAAEARKFEREAYLSLADEFDPMGGEVGPFNEADWDAIYVEGARAFAKAHDLPLPWEVRSMDEALRLVANAERTWY